MTGSFALSIILILSFSVLVQWVGVPLDLLQFRRGQLRLVGF